MQTIPAIYWMIILGGLSILFGLILYYVAMLIKEATSAITDSRKLIQNSNIIVEESMDIVKDVKGTVTKLKGTVEEANDVIIVPIRKIGGIINSITGFLDGFGLKSSSNKN